MCNYKSYIVLVSKRGKLRVVGVDGVDSHSEIVRQKRLGRFETLEYIAGNGGAPGFVKVEIVPDKDARDLANWTFIVDHANLKFPFGWDAKEAETLVHRELAALKAFRIAGDMVGRKTITALPEGLTVGGSLYLGGFNPALIAQAKKRFKGKVIA